MLPPTGAADTMHVIGKTPRQVVIDDVRHSINVDAAGGDISRYEHNPCFAVQAKTDENQPEFPPESLLKDKKEAECQDQCLLANGQQGVYSSYTRSA